MLSKQEIFDKCAVHLMTQGKKAMKPDTPDQSCMYRAPDGTKCAVGVLIPDHLYTSSMEGNSVPGLFQDFAPEMSMAGLDPGDMTFLQELQLIHDEYQPESWRRQLVYLADYFDLSTAVLNSTPLMTPGAVSGRFVSDTPNFTEVTYA